jgi:rod shape-determining protein MreD
VPGLCPAWLDLPAHPPDVWLLPVAYAAFRGRAYHAVGLGIALGLLRDCLSLDPLGTHGFVFGAVAYAFCEGRRMRPPVTGLPRLLLTVLAALLAGWLYLLRVLPLGADAPPLSEALHVVPTALWTGAASLLLFPLLDQTRVLDDLLGRARGLPA